jgi:hypothetical protein
VGDVVLALGFDLFFKPRLAEAARAAGVELRHAAPRDALAQAAGAARVVADVSAPGVLDAVLALRAARPELPVLACYPHVQADLARAVTQAGGRALPRGAFSERLVEALAGN